MLGGSLIQMSDVPYALRSWKNFSEWKKAHELGRVIDGKLVELVGCDNQERKSELTKEITLLAIDYHEIAGRQYVSQVPALKGRKR